MDQQCQHIVLTLHGGHVILERSCIHFADRSSEHIDNCIFQTVKIHINIIPQCLILIQVLCKWLLSISASAFLLYLHLIIMQTGEVSNVYFPRLGLVT